MAEAFGVAGHIQVIFRSTPSSTHSSMESPSCFGQMKIASFNINNINRRFTNLASATGGVGHKLPQEAPQAFAQAIVDVAEV